VRKWNAVVEGMASKWNVDMQAVEKVHETDAEKQS
jgi:hypothetical protein